jgi:sialate O-acetylesterase
MKKSCLLVLSLLSVTSTWSAVTLPNVIGNDMVLQRDLPVPIWGWAEPNEIVSVAFAGQTKETKTNAQGKWMVKLDKLSANFKPSVLSIKGSNEIKLQNILVGEVWICSGQSNMEWQVNRCANPQEEIAKANHPNIRLFDVPGHTVHPLPQSKGKGNWKVCTPATIPSFSATGYYFGRRIAKGIECPHWSYRVELGRHTYRTLDHS